MAADCVACHAAILSNRALGRKLRVTTDAFDNEPSGSDDDPLEALLGDDWISHASVRELSAEERAAAATAQAKAFRRDGRRARR